MQPDHLSSPPSADEGTVLSETEHSFTQRLVVKFNALVEDVESALDSLLSSEHFVIDYVAQALDGVVSLFVSDAAAGDAQETLMNSGMVEALQQDYSLGVASLPEVETAVTSDDPHVSNQWALNAVNAEAAWELAENAAEVVVAVLDTGIDFNHEDLDDVIWTNSGEIAGNGIDDDGNGYVDDSHGWDFFNNDNDASDDNGHGTAVSGIIAAEGNNGVGVAGLATNVKIMPLKFIGENGSGWFSDAIAAIDYAVANGAEVSNNSWAGVVHDNDLLEAILATQQHNHVFVAAAGNTAKNVDIDPEFPAAFNADNIISVGASDKNLEMAFFSNHGSKTVDLMAPGVGTLSAKMGGGYQPLSGTSLAAPHVTAVVAMLQGLHPDWSYHQIIQAVLDGVDKVESLEGLAHNGGHLNAAKALELSLGASRPAPEEEQAEETPAEESQEEEQANEVVPEPGEDSENTLPLPPEDAIPEDAIEGTDKSEKVKGTKKDDYLLGHDGDDTLLGKKGDDTLDGGAGRDVLKGGKGDDLLIGNAANDRLLGNAGNDEIHGDAGNDEILGGADDDYLLGGTGNDTLKGGSGDDLLEDENGADMMKGGAGDDIIVDHDAGGSTSALYGGSGNDKIIAVASEAGGEFILDGGVGEDVFYFGIADGAVAATTFHVTDFKAGQDKLNVVDFQSLDAAGNLLQNFNEIAQGASEGGVLGYYFENNTTVITGNSENNHEISIVIDGRVELTGEDFIFSGEHYSAFAEWM